MDISVIKKAISSEIKKTLYGCFCFECGSKKELHQHHVIPKSLGGVNTISLCSKCHSKIHNLNFRDHSILIKKGLKKTKQAGIILGRPKNSGYSDNEMLDKHNDILSELKKGGSIRKTAKKLNKGTSTVQRVKQILNKNNL
jgi:hypothetical protein